VHSDDLSVVCIGVAAIALCGATALAKLNVLGPMGEIAFWTFIIVMEIVGMIFIIGADRWHSSLSDVKTSSQER